MWIISFFHNIKLMMFLLSVCIFATKGILSFQNERTFSIALCYINSLEPPAFLKTTRNTPHHAQGGLNPKRLASGCSCSVSIQRLFRSETRLKVSLGWFCLLLLHCLFSSSFFWRRLPFYIQHLTQMDYVFIPCTRSWWSTIFFYLHGYTLTVS